MWLQQLRVRHVRNLEPQLHSFEPGVHWLTGLNGSGKTNWIEAIYVLLTGRSFRTHHLRELIRHGADTAHIEGEITCRGVSYHLHMRVHSSGKQLWMNQRPSREWNGLFPCSCWVPEDLQLVRGGPSYRRRFLDHHLIQTDPLYSHHLGRYQRALEQRVAMLKQGRLKGIEAFEAQMALSATYLVRSRLNTLSSLNTQFADRLQALGFDGKHELLYEGNPEVIQTNAYQEMWNRMREQELKFGQTLRGPHLDDVKIQFQGKDARRYASEGQARACVAALKLAEWQTLSQKEGQALILVDEVGMGLDRQRWELIGEWMQNWYQVFMTTPDPMPLTQKLTMRWCVQQGVLTRQNNESKSQ